MASHKGIQQFLASTNEYLFQFVEACSLFVRKYVTENTANLSKKDSIGDLQLAADIP